MPRSRSGIRAVHADSDGTYGAPRAPAELRDAGLRVNHKRVQRIMRRLGIVGVHLRKKHRTTVPEPGAARVEDRIGRDFTAEAPNTKYVGDITYLPVAGAKPLYLATVIDLCSRRLAGWAIADHMRADLVIDALAAAENTRGSLHGALFHSDHGAQYNALAEAFKASLKRETLQGSANWATADQTRLATFRWVTRYNTRRRHSHLGQASPITFEATLENRATTLAQAA